MKTIFNTKKVSPTLAQVCRAGKVLWSTCALWRIQDIIITIFFGYIPLLIQVKRSLSKPKPNSQNWFYNGVSKKTTFFNLDTSTNIGGKKAECRTIIRHSIQSAFSNDVVGVPLSFLCCNGRNQNCGDQKQGLCTWKWVDEDLLSYPCHGLTLHSCRWCSILQSLEEANNGVK